MRRVQKAAAVLAALALTTALAVPVWADGGSKNFTGTNNTFPTDNTAAITVNATYDVQKQYRVDLSWTDMNFIYTAGTWTTDEGESNLTYTGATGWNNNGGTNSAQATHTITLKNYSNANIGVKLEYKNSDTEDDTQSATDQENVTRNRVGCFFIPNKAEGLTVLNYSNYMIAKGSSIWLQRADADVAGMSPNMGSGTGKKFDSAGLNAQGTAVEVEIGVMMAGRPSKAHGSSNSELGTITVTLSDAGDTLTAPTTDYAWAFTQDNMTTGGAKVS